MRKDLFLKAKIKNELENNRTIEPLFFNWSTKIPY